MVTKHSQTVFKVKRLINNGGAKRDRTADLLRARQALSQLSYGPIELLFVTLTSGQFYLAQGILWRRIACYASHKITQR